MNIFLTFLIYKLDDTQTEKTKKKKKQRKFQDDCNYY